MIVLWKWFQNRDAGESRDPNGLYGLQDVFGRGGFPQNAPKPKFLGDLWVLRGFGQGPWPSPIGPLWALFSPLWALGIHGPVPKSWGPHFSKILARRRQLVDRRPGFWDP